MTATGGRGDARGGDQSGDGSDRARAVSWSRRAAATWLPPALLVVALALLWEAWVRIAGIQPYLLPAPSDVWGAFLEVKGLLPEHIATTAREAVFGLALASVIGVALAVAMASLPLARRVLYPVLVTSQTIPLVVLAPLLIVGFGLGMAPKIIVVALICFFPIVVATTDGLVAADPELVDLVRSMGGSRGQVLRIVRVPAALPAFFSGLKLAAAYAVAGAVIGEWVAASSGIGLFIERSRAAFRTDRVFVGIAVVALMSIALFLAAGIAARLVTPWMYATREDNDR